MFQRQISADGFGLRRGRVLVTVKIAELARGKDYAVACGDGLFAFVHVAPHHDVRVLLQIVFDNLVPADKVPPVRFEELLEVADKAGLQLIYIFQTLLAHLSLTQRTVAPRRFSRLVAAYVDILRWENVHHFQKHVFEEIIYAGVARAKVSLLVRFVCAGIFGVGGEGFFGVCRHFNFRHNRHAAFGGIIHEFAQLVWRVIAALCAGLAFFHVASVAVPPLFPRSIGAPRPEPREARITLDFHAPAGGIREVQVQAVEFVARHHVDLLLQKIYGEEVARNVEHHAAPLKGGGVRYRAARVGGGGRRFRCRSGQLPQRLAGAQESFCCGSLDYKTVGCNTYLVSLAPLCRIAFAEHDGASFAIC